MLNHKIELGGVGHRIEMDETLLVKRKYNRGRLVAQTWVIGILDVTTGQIHMEIVENRKPSTLIPIVKNHVKPGCMIITDDWNAYKKLGEIPWEVENEQYMYQHEVIRRSEGFTKHGELNIQSIGNRWSQMKRKMRAHSKLSKDDIKAYISEVMWRFNTKKDKLLESFINIMRAK